MSMCATEIPNNFDSQKTKVYNNLLSFSRPDLYCTELISGKTQDEDRINLLYNVLLPVISPRGSADYCHQRKMMEGYLKLNFD